MLPIILFAAASTIAQVHVEAFRQKIVELAPRGAQDCGSTAAVPADRIERCATEHLGRKAPFFCILAPPIPKDVAFDIRPYIEGYVGDRTGTLLRVTVDSRKKSVVIPVLGPHMTPPPVRVGGWVRPPEIVHQVRRRVDAKSIRGIVIVEAIVEESGAIRQTRILKPLPRNLDKIAEELLPKAKISPGTLFGRPIPVIFNFSAKVENGEIVVPVIYPRAATGLVP